MNTKKGLEACDHALFFLSMIPLNSKAPKDKALFAQLYFFPSLLEVLPHIIMQNNLCNFIRAETHRYQQCMPPKGILEAT